MTFNPNLAKVNVNLHTKYQGRRSNRSGVRALTDGQADGRYQACFAVDNHTKGISKSDNHVRLREIETSLDITGIVAVFTPRCPNKHDRTLRRDQGHPLAKSKMQIKQQNFSVTM